MEDLIAEVCSEVRDMLIEKNRAYGNSVGDPVRIFSSVDEIEQINVRIDDKLSRIAKGHEFQGDDTELDLIGYLVLKRCLKRKAEDAEVEETGVFPEDPYDPKHLIPKPPSKMGQTLAG
jgi:hypothetical protein